ncbi:aldo/keto reductase [uncultured Boseongicola sp.]|uniref:aldo/keto reductase n=1 Tax=uncultured Boseongicola sp. TaxID=1648499 RepID=UPI00263752D0|nr:aldo/keto reductase [uncultured Boseongicola sp.]
MDSLFHSRRKVADTSLHLPAFGMGTAHLGELYGTVEESVSQATLAAGWDGGVRYYDTAPWYGRGLSEHRLGGFLRTKPRDEFLITTKVGRTLYRPADPRAFDRGPWVGGLRFEVKFDYSYDGIMRSYEQALQRLALDTVDALVIHDLDSGFHDEEALAAHTKDLSETGMKALGELKSSGDIAAFGMGINMKEQLADLAQRVDLDFALVAMPYTLIDQDSLHTGMQACIERNVSVIIGAPFASGILATGSAGAAHYNYGIADAGVVEKVRRIEAVCASHGVSLQAAALQFPLSHPAAVAIIPGAAKPEELKANIASVDAEIPAAFWDDLKSEDLIVADAPVPFDAEGVGG